MSSDLCSCLDIGNSPSSVTELKLNNHIRIISQPSFPTCVAVPDHIQLRTPFAPFVLWHHPPDQSLVQYLITL